MNRPLKLGAVMLILGTGAALAKSDKAFLTDAIQGNMAEISIGDLASTNAATDGVTKFGQMLSKGHGDNNQKAFALANTVGVTRAIDVKPEAKKEMNKLEKLSGDAFDKGSRTTRWT